ncbi:MAG: aminotransferase class I/II-fold pyridoxal phosphate-dependent enzyme [bacterium]
MIHFSKRLEQFPEYIFSRLAKEVKMLEQKTGKKVLNLAPGSPNIPPSKEYQTQLKQYIDEQDAYMYPGYGAISEFRDSLIQWYLQRFGVVLEENELYPLLGAKDGVVHLPLTLLDAGDEVLIPDPGYPSYTSSVRMVFGNPVFYGVTKENGFTFSCDEIESKITNKTKYIWLNYPHNPTGGTVSKDDLQSLVTLARKRNVLLVYDNAYSEITFGSFRAPSILEIDGAKDVAIEMGSFSKTFSFAGYRIGFVVGNAPVIQAFAKVKSQIDSGLSLSLQRLAAYALLHPDTIWHQNMIQTYQDRRDSISSYLKMSGLTFSLPKGGLYVWARIPDAYDNAETFALELLHKRHIVVTPGTAFGANGERYVRVSICTDITNIKEYF